MRNSPAKSAFVISVIYALMAGIWALLMDLALDYRLIGPASYAQFDLPVDAMLASATAVVVFLLLRREFTIRERVNEALRRSHDELELHVQQRTQALDAERTKMRRMMDTMPDGICIINPQYGVEYINPVMEKELGAVNGRRCHAYLSSQDEPCPGCKITEVIAGQNARQEWLLEKTRKIYDRVSTPVTDSDGKTLTLEVFHDITERRAAEREQARLWTQMNSQRLLYQAVMDHAPVSIALFTAADMCVRWANKQYQQNLAQTPRDDDLSGQHVTEIFPDAAKDGMLDIFAQVAATGEAFYDPEFEYSAPGQGPSYWQWSLMPLPARGEGLPDLMLLANDISNQVVARKRLEDLNAEVARQAEQAHRDRSALETYANELVALLHVSRDLASTLEMQPLLDAILSELKIMVDYSSAAILVLQGNNVSITAYRGPLPHDELLGAWTPLEEAVEFQEVLKRREPVIIDDVQSDGPLAHSQIKMTNPQMHRLLQSSRSWMGIPLLAKDRMIGLLRLDHVEPGQFTPHHGYLALTIANQAATAMENIRLYEEAGKVAALEERQRLARELHDSVSQALYGISLGSHAAREQLTRAPGKVGDTLNYVLGLADTAVNEMRALVFELRPESLEQEGLVAALSRQAVIMRSRDQVHVSLELGQEPALSLAAKEALYRVAQEALRNTVKHAHAKNVNVRLRTVSDWIVLEVGDDGIGFNPADRFPGHLGLQSMRERASRLGGTLEIESTPNRGPEYAAGFPPSRPIDARLYGNRRARQLL